MSQSKRKLKQISSSVLYDKALEIAKENSLEELYEKTQLPFSWLRKFRAGSIKNPSVGRIEHLLVKMTGEASTK